MVAFLQKISIMLYNYHIYATVASSISTINALAVQQAQSLNNESALSLPPSTIRLANHTSNLTATANRDHQINCDEHLYGQPATVSCADAVGRMMDNSTEGEFRDRSSGTSDYPLPYRITSGQSKLLLPKYVSFSTGRSSLVMQLTALV